MLSTASNIALRDHNFLDDMSEGEQSAWVNAQREKWRKAESRSVARESRVEADGYIPLIAAAMRELAQDNTDALDGLTVPEVAEHADLFTRDVKRNWTEALWLARRVLADKTKCIDSSNAPYTYGMKLAVAYQALASPETAAARAEGLPPPYSPAQARLVSLDNWREQRINATQYEPSPQRFALTPVLRIKDGYRWLGGMVGSSSDTGGKYYNSAFVEVGALRSNRTGNEFMKRFLGAVARATPRRDMIWSDEYRQQIFAMEHAGANVRQIAAALRTQWPNKFGRDAQSKTARNLETAVRQVLWNREHRSVLRTGPHSDQRLTHEAKILAMDHIHGSLRTDCKEIFRAVDYDGDFGDVQELMNFIATKKARPQSVVWIRDDRWPERICHPHFLFALPEGSGVWYGERKGTAMLEAVAAAICAEYGGDPGGLHNLFDCKFMTSPHCESIFPELECLPTLSQLCAIYDVDLRNGLTREARRQCVEQMVAAGTDRDVSMGFFGKAGARAWEIATFWRETGRLSVGPTMDRTDLQQRLLESLMGDEALWSTWRPGTPAEEKKAIQAVRAQARSVAQNFGRGKTVSKRGYDLGAAEIEVAKALADVDTTDMTAKEADEALTTAAQSAGGRFASQKRAERSIRRIADHMRPIIAEGHVPAEAEIIVATGMDPRTVRRHWDNAVASIAAIEIVAVIRDRWAGSTFSSYVWGVTPTPGHSDKPALPQIVRSPALRSMVQHLPAVTNPSDRPAHGWHLLEFIAGGVRIIRPNKAARSAVGRTRSGRRIGRPVIDLGSSDRAAPTRH